MAYADDRAPLFFLSMHGGFACLFNLLFYATVREWSPAPAL